MKNKTALDDFNESFDKIEKLLAENGPKLTKEQIEDIQKLNKLFQKKCEEKLNKIKKDK